MSRVVTFLSIPLLSLNLFAADFQTGEFKLTSTPVELLGVDAAQAFADVIDPEEEIEWSLYVPENYNPKQPSGLLVGVGGFFYGAFPQNWKSVVEDKYLVWVSENIGGPRYGVRGDQRDSIVKAILATVIVAQRYRIDSRRTYAISHDSMADVLASNYPELFRGVITRYRAIRLADIDPKKLELMRANRYVFWRTSYGDGANMMMKKAHKSYIAAGIENSLYIDYSYPGVDTGKKLLAETIKYLDSRD